MSFYVVRSCRCMRVSRGTHDRPGAAIEPGWATNRLDLRIVPAIHDLERRHAEAGTQPPELDSRRHGNRASDIGPRGNQHRTLR